MAIAFYCHLYGWLVASTVISRRVKSLLLSYIGMTAPFYCHLK